MKALKTHLTNWAGIRREEKAGDFSTTTGGVFVFRKAKDTGALIKSPTHSSSKKEHAKLTSITLVKAQKLL